MSESEKQINRSVLLGVRHSLKKGMHEMPKIPGLALNPDVNYKRKKLEDRLFIPPRKNSAAVENYSFSMTPSLHQHKTIDVPAKHVGHRSFEN